MANQVTLIYKLQRALQQKGYIIVVSSYQIYNEDSKKFIKIYSISHGREVIIKTSSCIKIVKYLADCLKTINNNPEILEMSTREQNELMDSICRKW